MRSKELVEVLRSEGISINWASLMQAIHRRRIRAPLKDHSGSYFFGTDEIREARAYFSKTPPAPGRRPSRRTTKVPLLVSDVQTILRRDQISLSTHQIHYLITIGIVGPAQNCSGDFEFSLSDIDKIRKHSRQRPRGRNIRWKHPSAMKKTGPKGPIADRPVGNIDDVVRRLARGGITTSAKRLEGLVDSGMIPKPRIVDGQPLFVNRDLKLIRRALRG
jgi:hypothetical protein